MSAACGPIGPTRRYYATLLGNRILGGDFLSRLNQNLREKNGYTYGARSGFRFRRSGSLWNVSTAVRTDATAPALKEVLTELDGLAGTKPLNDQEIAAALGAEVKSYPDQFESPRIDRRDPRAKWPSFIFRPITSTRFSPVSRRTWPRDPQDHGRGRGDRARVTLVVGDRKVIEPKLRALGIPRSSRSPMMASRSQSESTVIKKSPHGLGIDNGLCIALLPDSLVERSNRPDRIQRCGGGIIS